MGDPDNYTAGINNPLWTDGFQNGLMWGHGFGDQDDKGGIYFYTYHQDMPGLYGESFRWGNFKFQTDPERWYNVTIRMVMNTIKSDGSGGNYDGIMEGFVDGKLVLSKTGMRFRNVSTVHINKMKIYSFFGGSGSDYGATRDEWSQLDDIYLFTYSSGVNVPRGNTPSPAGRVLQLPNLKTASSANITDTTSPSVPGGLTVTGKTENNISLSWNASTDNTKVTGYHIWLDGKNAGSASGTVYKISGLNAGTSYSVAVSAFDAASNESAKSKALSVTTTEIDQPDTLAPSIPTGLTITGITDTTASLSWSLSTDNIGVSGYIVFVDGIVKGTVSSTSYTIGDLTPNTSYLLTVSAYDSSSNKSAESEALNVTTENATTSDPDTTAAETEQTEISILEVHNDTENNAKTVSEIRSYGNSELRNFGVMISKNENPVIGGIMYIAETGMYYVKNDNRVARNLQVLYNFSECQGSQVKDISGNGTPVNLEISNPYGIKWLSGQGLKVTDNTIISSGDESGKLVQSLAATNEISMEAWVKPAEIAQAGPARIVSLSTDNYSRATTLGQTGNAAGYAYNVRLNTTSTDQNGMPECSSNEDFKIVSLQHIVYTRDRYGNEKIYVNGLERYSGKRTGDFSSWGDGYKLVLANELTGNRPWRGTYYLVAIYNRALNDKEVVQNYNAGYGKLLFNSVLDNLEPETHYYLSAFAETDQGMHYGDVVDLHTYISRHSDADSIQLNVYPNPSDGIFHVSFEYNKVDHATITISDLNGKIIHSSIIPVNKFDILQEKQFNLGNNLKNGVYFVTLNIGSSISSRKLIIQH